MKERKKVHGETPVADAPAPVLEILQKIARTFRHSHRTATAEDVATRLREWFEAEGREVDEVAIDEALGE
jgi:hypothetical protein